MAALSWHVEALNDLDAICAFIARDSPVSAEQFAARIVSAAEHLLAHTELGRIVPEIGEPDYREIIFQNYRIVYRTVRDDVVIHAAMDLERQVEKRS